MRLANLDMDVLRTLAVAMDLGGFGKAAVRLGRSQSAVSLQMRKLEEQVGRPLFRREGRALGLTEAGDLVLGYARRILALNDEAVAAARGVTLEGSVRFGLPQDFGDAWLPGVLARFNRAYPSVYIEARVERTNKLMETIAKGGLDLALVWGAAPSAHVTPIAKQPMAWIGRKEFDRATGDPVNLALFEAPCVFRQPAIEALDRARIPWRLTFTTPSLAGLWAAAAAGLGLTVRTPFGLPPHLAILDGTRGLPKLPDIELALYAADPSPPPAVLRLRDIVLEELSTALTLRKPMRRRNGH
jgi:DNA-binding transcriptional LysR family regulator